MTDDLPLGRDVDYPDTYSPSVLAAVSRQGSRDGLGLADSLPFQGEDIWNAWELTWLGPSRKPEIAAVEIRVPLTSAALCESKSLKLYLNSFAMSEFASHDSVRETIAADLSTIVEAPVLVQFLDPGHRSGVAIETWTGTCIDDTPVSPAYGDTLASPPVCNLSDRVSEALYSELFRSLCPVTGQPDYASILVRYDGPRIDRESLLQYLLSYRQHQDFHEACVERIFTDIAGSCRTDRLLVSARFQRRGGIDINPWRANYDASVSNQRLWRQ